MKKILTPAEKSLADLLAIVRHGDAPYYPGLVQDDWVRGWYVRLASAVDEACDRLDLEPTENVEADADV